MIFFLCFPKTRIWHFMQFIQIVSFLHEMSYPVFLGKVRKIFQNVVCWKFYPECKAVIVEFCVNSGILRIIFQMKNASLQLCQSTVRLWLFLLFSQQPNGLRLKYKIHMTNGPVGDYLHREYSADEFCKFHLNWLVTVTCTVISAQIHYI